MSYACFRTGEIYDHESLFDRKLCDFDLIRGSADTHLAISDKIKPRVGHHVDGLLGFDWKQV